MASVLKENKASVLNKKEHQGWSDLFHSVAGKHSNGSEFQREEVRAKMLSM